MASPSRIPVLRRRSRSVPPVVPTPQPEQSTPAPAVLHTLFMSEQHIAAMDKLVSLVESLNMSVQEQGTRLVAMEQRLSRAATTMPTAPPTTPLIPRGDGCSAKSKVGGICEGSLSKKTPLFVQANGTQYPVCRSHKTAKVVLTSEGREVAVDPAPKQLTA